MKMMNRHYAALNGASEDVEMPFEKSGMMVDRKPATASRVSSSMSGIGFEPPQVRPRPAPPEFTIRQPPTSPTPSQTAPPGYHFMPYGTLMANANHNLGSISKPKVAKSRLNGLKGWAMYGSAFLGIMGLTYMTHRYLNQEDDE